MIDFKWAGDRKDAKELFTITVNGNQLKLIADVLDMFAGLGAGEIAGVRDVFVHALTSYRQLRQKSMTAAREQINKSFLEMRALTWNIGRMESVSVRDKRTHWLHKECADLARVLRKGLKKRQLKRDYIGKEVPLELLDAPELEMYVPLNSRWPLAEVEHIQTIGETLPPLTIEKIQDAAVTCGECLTTTNGKYVEQDILWCRNCHEPLVETGSGGGFPFTFIKGRDLCHVVQGNHHVTITTAEDLATGNLTAPMRDREFREWKKTFK